jgi:hypothetical protein
VAVDGTREIATGGSYAYVATGSGLSVADFRNPTQPEVVGSMTASDPAGGILDAKVDSDHVYVGAETCAGESGGIRVFDVTDFDDPQQVAEIEAEDRNNGIFADTSHNFGVTSNRLYTAWYNAGTRVYDIILNDVVPIGPGHDLESLVLGPFERAAVVVDFSGHEGETLTVTNHLVGFRVIGRGPDGTEDPALDERGPKDVVRVDPGETVRIRPAVERRIGHQGV